MLVMWWDANENCKAILGGQNVGFALLCGYRKMLVMWWDANENCKAILGGQNAGFALLCFKSQDLRYYCTRMDIVHSLTGLPFMFRE